MQTTPESGCLPAILFLLGIVGGALGFVVVARDTTAASPAPMPVVATVPVAMPTPMFTEGVIAIQDIPCGGRVPPQAVSWAPTLPGLAWQPVRDPEAVIGRYAVTTLYREMPILPVHLTDDPEAVPDVCRE